MIIREMIKELDVMLANGLIKNAAYCNAVEALNNSDQDEIDDFDYMGVSEAVDLVLQMTGA